MRWSWVIVTSVMCAMVLLPGAAFAWGPHPSITAAAIAVLPQADRDFLGAQAKLLTEQYCWYPDMWWQHGGIVNGKKQPDLRAKFNLDRYVLSPATGKDIPHYADDVIANVGPYFDRALKMLRQPDLAEGCRYMGAVVHYTEDTGAPCHARKTSGKLHGPMENWIKSSEINITGYSPRLLAQTPDKARERYIEKLRRLQTYSARIAVDVEDACAKGDKARAEAGELLCANEAARTTADTIHTFVYLATHTGGSACQGSCCCR